MKKVSMKDIANELDISITTVSFVINGKSEEMGISAATANKVHELIKKEVLIQTVLHACYGPENRKHWD